MQRMREHAWPGNVRELRTVIERAICLGTGRSIRVGDLPPEIGRTAGGEGIRLALGRTLDDVEREYLEATLRRLGGHRTRAAKALGISQKTLYSKLRRYALDDRT
jgi:DNA-binding NtrC family response regulator